MKACFFYDRRKNDNFILPGEQLEKPPQNQQYIDIEEQVKNENCNYPIQVLLSIVNALMVTQLITLLNSWR